MTQAVTQNEKQPVVAKKANIARSAFWTLAESASLSGLSLIVLVVLSRHLTPVEMGIASIALGAIQLPVMLVERLFHDPVVQRKELPPAFVNAAHTATLLLSVALTALCWAIASAYARAIGQPEVGPVMRWMSLSVLAMGASAILVALHRRRMEFRTLTIRSLLARVVAAVVAMLLAVQGAGVWSLVTQQVLLLGLAALVLWIMAGSERPRWGWDASALRDMLRLGGPSIIQQFAAFSVPRVYIMMFGTLLGSAATGYMGLAFRVTDMLRELVASAASQLALPVFASIERNGGDREAAYIRATRLTTALAFPIFATLAAVSQDLVAVVFGSAWSNTHRYVVVLSLLALYSFARMFSTPLLTAVGKPAAALHGQLGQVGALLVLMPTVGHWSSDWAMGVWVARLLVSAPIDMWMLKRHAQISYASQWSGCLATGAAALLTAGILWLVSGAFISLEPWLRLAALCVVSVPTYLALLRAIAPNLLHELIAFVRSAAAGKRSRS